jgi:fructosamine-3-kinase
MLESLLPILAPWLELELGVQLVGLRPVGGGCTHAGWCLQLADGGRLFAKTDSAAKLPLLAAERAGLEALAPWAPASLELPRPLALGTVAGWAVLVLSWLDLAAADGSAPGWRQLGADLARLHRASRAGNGGRGYGFAQDNFIGSAPQANGWCLDWPTFFAAARLKPQLALAVRRGQGLAGGERLLERLPGWLGGHGVEPVLVHGDLWCGNAALVRGGGAALYDPACHWADREVDLAMARLFGGFPAAFFEGYEQIWPLPEGAGDRVALYNLYHLLNHANLFGEAYRRQAQASLNRLLARPA